MSTTVTISLHPDGGISAKYTGGQVTDDQKNRILGILSGNFDTVQRVYNSLLDFSQTSPGISIRQILPSCTFAICAISKTNFLAPPLSRPGSAPALSKRPHFDMSSG